MLASPVQADIYQHTDANGVVTYSNLKRKGAIKLNISNSSDFSQVDTDLQKQRDAKEAAKPEIARRQNVDGTVTTYRNMAKFNEKMKPMQAEVGNHQNNIELLQKELNGMR